MSKTISSCLRVDTAALAALVLASVLVTSHAASARDRPGTPNNEKAYTCGDYLAALPAVCVEFDNTASEKVGFDIEMTVNGEKVSEGRPHATCFGIPNAPKSGCINCGIQYQGGPNYNCEAATNFNQGSGSAFATGRSRIDQVDGRTVLPQGFRLNDLEYDTAYCFRFKARRASDGVVSELWSNWACAQTAESPPPKPTAPQNLVATYMPGGMDWRKQPPKVSLKWAKGEHTADQTVQKKSKAYDPNQFREIVVLKRGEAEFSEIPTEDDVDPNGRTASILYRVCAVNISGKACSQSASTFTPPLEVEQAGPRVGDILKEEEVMKEKGAMTPTPMIGDIVEEQQVKQKALDPTPGPKIGDILKETEPAPIPGKAVLAEPPAGGGAEFATAINAATIYEEPGGAALKDANGGDAAMTVGSKALVLAKKTDPVWYKLQTNPVGWVWGEDVTIGP
jgi:hypothetical protein